LASRFFIIDNESAQHSNDHSRVTTVSSNGYARSAMDEEVETGRRKIVLHPRTAAARRVDRNRSHSSHVRGFTVQNNEVFELVAEQRKLAFRAFATILIPVFLLLLSFVFLPELTNFSIRGIPLPWLLLGPVSLFSIIVIAWRHDRAALRKERDWAAEHGDDEQ